jgi:plasmid stability protein
MPSITLKNIPEELYQRIKATAHVHKRSMNREILFSLERSLDAEPRLGVEKSALLREIDELRARTSRLPPLTDKEIRRAKNLGRP